MPHDYQKLNRLIGANAYWQVNKFLAREYGLDVAILLADLVSKGAYFAERDELDPDGYFFNTRESIEEDTTLSPHKQRVAIKALVEAGVLETKSVGIPRKTYYRVVNDKLLKILTTGGEKIQPLEVKKFNGNKNKEIRIKNNVETLVSTAKAKNQILDGEKIEYGSQQINIQFEQWENKVGYPIEGRTQANRRACYNLLRKHGSEKLGKLLDGVAVSQEDQYAPRIGDFVTLQAKQNELIAWGRRKRANPTAIDLDTVEV